jgi:hypothetical protein
VRLEGLARDFARAEAARWRVFCWQSISGTPCSRHSAISAASAIFDASVRQCENIDSPKNMRPIDTPYSPPTRVRRRSRSRRCARGRAACQAM